MKLFKKKWQNIIAAFLIVIVAAIVGLWLYIAEALYISGYTWNHPDPLPNTGIGLYLFPIALYIFNIIIVACALWLLISLIHKTLQYSKNVKHK